MKKKALIFIEDGSFTYDNRVIREAEALIDAGWDISIVCPKYPDDVYYQKLGNNLRVYFYPKPNAETAIGHLFEHTTSLFFGSLLTLWISLRHGFSVFQACNPMDILWIIAWPYKLLGKKFIFDQHDLCPELLLSREGGSKDSLFYNALIFLEKLSFKTADAVIATNESYKHIAIERGGVRPEDVFVVRNGPDLKKFKVVPAKAGYKKDNEILVGYLGNMNYQDGVDYLLEAANHILKSRNNIKFILVGGGSHQANLKNMSESMGMAQSVTFTGRLPDADMLETLCACDICVQPDPTNALNDLSTMNKVMEYMALGKPVVTFDLKETRVSCGEAAVYAKPNDTQEMAEKIMCLADDAELRQEMSVKGMQRVKQFLSWEHSVPKLEGAYDYVNQEFTGKSAT